MELFQVRYFLVLAKTLNFTRAAETCNVSQPALTRAIQRLEEEFGGPLLLRERNLTQLTELGRLMLPHLEAAAMATETAAVQAAAFKQRDAAPLRLGLSTTISSRILTPVLRELEERVKSFELAVTEGGSDTLFEEMLSGEIDTAVVVAPEKLPERLNRWPLFEGRYVVLCPTMHRFSNQLEVLPTALAEECVLARARRGCDFESLLLKLCNGAGVKPRRRHHGGSEDHIQHMVSAGLGVAISAEDQPLVEGVVAKPLADPAARRRIVVTAVAGRPYGPGLSMFLKLMRARDWAALEPGAGKHQISAGE